MEEFNLFEGRQTPFAVGWNLWDVTVLKECSFSNTACVLGTPQQAFTCSKSKMEERCVEFVQS